MNFNAGFTQTSLGQTRQTNLVRGDVLESNAFEQVEMRSDAFKVCFLHRRGIPSTRGLGRSLSQWLPVLKIIAVVSTAKNLTQMIASLSSGSRGEW